MAEIWTGDSLTRDEQKGLEAELKKINLKLERLSQTDGLTGLQNRRHFDECLGSR